MDLNAIRPSRPAAEVEVEVVQWNEARRTSELLKPQLLPSEAAPHRALRERTEAELARREAEKRSLGRLDLAALLKQTRPGDPSAPRWMLYPAMCPCDSVAWLNLASVTFEPRRDRRAVQRISTGLPNPLPRNLVYTAATILLPARVREKVVELNRASIVSYVLYEPRLVESVSIPDPKLIALPDPALVIEAGGDWWIVDYWDQPDVEDPRALSSLREFFVSTSRPPWIRNKS